MKKASGVRRRLFPMLPILMLVGIGLVWGPRLRDVVRSRISRVSPEPPKADIHLRGLAASVAASVQDEALLGILEVTPESPVAAVGKVKLDFGAYNLDEALSLRVASLPTRSDTPSGMHAQSFRLSVGEGRTFPVPVAVTLPYEAVGVSETEQPPALIVAKLEKDTLSWRIFPTEVDSSSKTVTFHTRSFSTFSILQNTLSEGRAFYYPDNTYRGPATEVRPCLPSLLRQLEDLNTEPFELLIRGEPVPAQGLMANGLTLVNALASGGSHAYAVDEHLIASLLSSGLKNNVAERFTQMGNLALACKIMDQWLRGVTAEDIIRDNAFSLLEVAATGVSAYFGGPYMAVCAGGLWLAGMGDALVNRPVDLREDTDLLEKAYRLASPGIAVVNMDDLRVGVHIPVQGRTPPRGNLMRMNTRTAWAKVIGEIRDQTEGDPGEMKRRVDAFVREYSNVFWHAAQGNHAGDLRWYLDELITRHPDFSRHRSVRAAELPWPAEGAPALVGPGAREVVDPIDSWQTRRRAANAKTLQQRFIERTHLGLRAIYSRLAEETRQEMLQALYTEHLEMAEAFNEEIVFELKDPSLSTPGFAKSAYAEHVFLLRTNGNYQEDFFLRERHRDSDRVFVCNVYHYITAGMPDTLLVLPPGAGDAPLGHLHTMAQDIIRFTVQQPTTWITLPEKLDIMEFLLPADRIPGGLVEHRREDQSHTGPFLNVEIASLTLRSGDYDLPGPPIDYSRVIPLGDEVGQESIRPQERQPLERRGASEQPLRVTVHMTVARGNPDVLVALIDEFREKEIPSLRESGAHEWHTPAGGPDMVRIRLMNDLLLTIRCTTSDARAHALVEALYPAALRHVRDQAQKTAFEVQRIPLPTAPPSPGVGGESIQLP